MIRADDRADKGNVRVLPLMGLCWLLATSSVSHGLWKSVAGPLPSVSRLRVDPNVAPWWELSVLEGIGPAIARRIVALRESGSPPEHPDDAAFRSAGDLDAVSGIGPMTIRRIAGELRFNAVSGRNPHKTTSGREPTHGHAETE